MDGTAWWPGVASGPTCGAMLGSPVVSTVSSRAYTTGTYSLGITPQQASVLIVAFLAGNEQNGDTGMSVAGPGYASLLAYDFGANETTGQGYAAGTGGTLATFSGTYNGGGNPASSRECAAIVALRTSHAVPVQTGTGVYNGGVSPIVLGATPTTGDTLVLVEGIRGYAGTFSVPTQPAPYPRDGKWVMLAWAEALPAEPFNQKGAVIVWGRCMAAGDGSTYGRDGGSIVSAQTLSEWTP